MRDLDIGERVELQKPYRGYRTGEVIGYENCMYIIQFSSGMEACFYDDEFIDPDA